jgi:RNA polymerase subunit RPABC4/transcription elongation factor Spt4
MGICKNCGSDIVLRENETTCPACGLNPYNCWNCKKELPEKRKKCNSCDWGVCPDCGVCSPDCVRTTDLAQLEKMMPGITKEKAEAILDWFGNRKRFQRRICPKNVPISYAKEKHRTYALKFQGTGTKNEFDKEAFRKRLLALEDLPIGASWTINQKRDFGRYGVEERETSNIGVCMGWLKKDIVKNKKGKYELYTRVNNLKICQECNWKDLLTKYCPSCKRIFPKEMEICPDCEYKKGPRKGLGKPLKEKKSYKSFCQLPRISFKLVKDG